MPCSLSEPKADHSVGNVNNDAWSNSLMIDVVASPKFFREMQLVPEQYTLATNASVWADESILDGPHLPIKELHNAQCGERVFARFMFHQILPQSRVAAILKNGVMFGGIWAMHEGSKGTARYLSHALNLASASLFVFMLLLIHLQRGTPQGLHRPRVGK